MNGYFGIKLYKNMYKKYRKQIKFFTKYLFIKELFSDMTSF